MGRFFTVARITLSLLSICVSLIFTANTLGLLPNSWEATLKGWISLSESVAVQVSTLVDRGNVRDIQENLEWVKSRNPDLISIGVRSASGNLLVEVGSHQSMWQDPRTVKDAPKSNILIPIAQGDHAWGTVEMRFRPLFSQGWRGTLELPAVRFAIFFVTLGSISYFLYLRRVLAPLDPSRVVPTRVRSALDSLAEGLMVLDRDERVVMANQSMNRLIGIKPEDLLGKKASKLPWKRKEDEDSLDGSDPWPWRDVLKDSQPRQGTLMQMIGTTDENVRTFTLNTAPILDDKGNLRGVVVSLEDVTPLERKQAELSMMLARLDASTNKIKQQNRDLEELATRDPLTGCWNRRSFFEKFEKHWHEAVREGKELSCIMVDVDHFKSVNDTFGHSVGDDVLRGVSKALKLCARDTDIVGRYGGEEFAVLLPGAEIESAFEAGERLRLALAALKFPQLSITASFGASSMALGAEHVQGMLEQADQALYFAKKTGRNRVTKWSPGCLEAVIESQKAEEATLAESAETTSRRDRAAELQNYIAEIELPLIPFPAVTALISALKYRDHGTAEHSRRVADLAVSVAEGLISRSECYVLEVASLLHDIGKIGVPDHILLKPGSLTKDEWRIMEQHDRIGGEIIRAAFNSTMLSSIVETHHAFFGGGARHEGMPTGLDIPLGARILTIADAYDAMVSDRVYRKGRSPAEAFAELRRCAGTQFDPELVERFIEVVTHRNAQQPNQSFSIRKELALSIGLQMERLSAAVDDRDLKSLGALAERLRLTAEKHGCNEVSSRAADLAGYVEGDGDLLRVLETANELLDVCRMTQQSFLRDSDGGETIDARELAVAP